jgi:hypothetical protein
VSRPPSGRPYYLEGIFLSGVHEAENPHDWIARVRTRFALRCAEKPAAKAGQIKALWPEIEAAIERGQSIKSIHKWLEEDAGLRLGITSLTSYISRIRRREAAAARRSEAPVGQSIHPVIEPTASLQPPRGPLAIHDSNHPRSAKRDDPLAQAMSVLSKPGLDIRKIHNDGDPEGRNLI